MFEGGQPRCEWTRSVGKALFVTFMLVTGLLLGFRVEETTAQAIQIITVPNEPILNNNEGVPFKSWSLFLICNPAWLLKENSQMVWGLLERFEAFGKSIGKDHLAVWFWQSKPRQGMPVADFLDVDRSSQYCDKYGLLPSESPHVLVTTTYPHLTTPVKDYSFLALNGINPDGIMRLLNTLADQLKVQGLQQKELGSRVWWETWWSSIAAIGSRTSDLMQHVKLTFDTKFFKIEYTPR